MVRQETDNERINETEATLELDRDERVAERRRDARQLEALVRTRAAL